MTRRPVAHGRASAGRDALSPTVFDGLARGRARFNKADFWGSHEALERAWRSAPEGEKPFLQGLIQAAAAFHKIVVQDNRGGAGRLLGRSLESLSGYPADHAGIDLPGFRNQLQAWRDRLERAAPGAGPMLGLPRLDWSTAAAERLLRVDRIDLYAVEVNTLRAVLVSVTAEGETGWGECRHRWGTYGLWGSLVEAVAPGLLAEPVAMPGELSVAWPDLVHCRAAWAGVEAAMWDLWSRLRALPLHRALGIDSRPVRLAYRLAPGDTTDLAQGVRDGHRLGFSMIVAPARPNADRRVLPGLVEGADLPMAFDLGAAYRPADIDALRALDELQPVLLANPVPTRALAAAARLRRWLHAPIGLGSWPAAEEALSAIDLGAADTLIIDSGRSGLTEAREIADRAAETGAGVWVVSTAATPVGAAADLALAMHENARFPADLSSVVGREGAPSVLPGSEGTIALLDDAVGIGFVPAPAWLVEATTRHVVLNA